jgi:transcriptional regulator with XRE-family HTH domain
MKHLPTTIAIRRKRCGLSKSALASAAGISPSAMTKIEKGHWNIGVKTLSAIARALDTTPWQLLRNSNTQR